MFRPSRRKFLAGGLGAVAAATLAACGGQPKPAVAPLPELIRGEALLEVAEIKPIVRTEYHTTPVVRMVDDGMIDFSDTQATGALWSRFEHGLPRDLRELLRADRVAAAEAGMVWQFPRLIFPDIAVPGSWLTPAIDNSAIHGSEIMTFVDGLWAGPATWVDLTHQRVGLILRDDDGIGIRRDDNYLRYPWPDFMETIVVHGKVEARHGIRLGFGGRPDPAFVRKFYPERHRWA